jgi:hypothetical protein
LISRRSASIVTSVPIFFNSNVAIAQPRLSL